MACLGARPDGHQAGGAQISKTARTNCQIVVPATGSDFAVGVNLHAVLKVIAFSEPPAAPIFDVIIVGRLPHAIGPVHRQGVVKPVDFVIENAAEEIESGWDLMCVFSGADEL